MNWRKRLVILGSAAMAIGIGVGIRLTAKDGSSGDAASGPPRISVSLANATLLSDDFPRDDVEMFGKLLNSWREEGTQIVQYRGEFRLDYGGRRHLSADNAVIWITPRLVGNTTLKRFVVYLEGQVRITEGEQGTVTDSRHIATFQTTGRVWTDADTRVEQAGNDTELYRHALTFRDQHAPGAAPGAGSPVVPVAARKLTPAPPQVTYRGGKTTAKKVGDEWVVIATDGVYISRTDPNAPNDPSSFVEIRSREAVLFATSEGSSTEDAQGRQVTAQQVTGVYLRDDVIMTRGERSIQASEIYYDMEYDRALILDAVMYTRGKRRDQSDVPVYMWAERMRQLSPTDYRAYNAKVTTSEMFTPVTDLTAKQVDVHDVTKRAGPYEATQYNAIEYKTRNQLARIRGVPIAYWPGSQGTFSEGETALRTIRVGMASDFGASIETQWHLFKLLNMQEPAGFDMYLNLDAFSERGVAAGIDGKYLRDNFYGKLNSYLVLDNGSDNLGRDRPDEKQQQETIRYWARWQHRQYLQQNWEFTGEISLLSDRNFLEEWFKDEFDTGKDQETLAYVKKVWDDNNAFTGLFKIRLNDFLNQVEKLPEVKYYKLGEPLFDNKVVLFGEAGATVYNRAVDTERTDIKESGVGFRGDARIEAQFPVKLGPINLVPYAIARGTVWTNGWSDSDPNSSSNGGGGTGRVYGAVGLHSATNITRVFNDVENRFWDIHRLRWLMKPEVNLHLAAMSVNRDELQPLDPTVEGINGSSFANVSWRNVLQTKRGGPDHWRTVDWMILDLELTAFVGDPTKSHFEPEATRPPVVLPFFDKDVYAFGYYAPSRPEESFAPNGVVLDYFYQWRISDTTSLLANGNFGPGGLDIENIGFALERWPRLSLYFGQRYIRALDSNDLVFSANYQIDRKYRVNFTYAWDMKNSATAVTRITLVRQLQRWYAALTFEYSQTAQRQLVMLSFWPQGAREIRFGRGVSQWGASTESGGQ
ncbi:MAG: LPS-assembly protein LptD [Phycisphaerae bacterium]|nr:LPS-assembly protein LptD [Phycisphaerae bacterium]